MATSPASAAAPASPLPPNDPLLRFLVRPLVAAYMYGKGPITVYRTSRVRTSHAITPLDDEADRALRPESRAFLDRSDAALGTLGFDAPVRGVLRGQANATSYFSLSEHRTHGVLATLAAIQTVGSPLVPPRNVQVIFYRSEFADDVAILTTNGPSKRRFPRRPDLDGVRFPAVRDPEVLYRIHRFRAAERERRVPMRGARRGADPLRYQQREAEESWERWVTIGYYRRLPDGVLAPTKRGALCLAWRGMVPWRQLVDWRDAHQAAAVLRRWKAAGSP